jgi:hypothetical protein
LTSIFLSSFGVTYNSAAIFPSRIFPCNLR